MGLFGKKDSAPAPACALCNCKAKYDEDNVTKDGVLICNDCAGFVRKWYTLPMNTLTVDDAKLIDAMQIMSEDECRAKFNLGDRVSGFMKLFYFSPFEAAVSGAGMQYVNRYAGTIVGQGVAQLDNFYPNDPVTLICNGQPVTAVVVSCAEATESSLDAELEAKGFIKDAMMGYASWIILKPTAPLNTAGIKDMFIIK